MNEPLLVVEDLGKDFGDRTVLQGVNIRVYPGEIVGLLGPNGAGKTTLLRIISGIYKPSRGRVLVGGYEPRSIEALKMLTYCPQEHGLFEELSGWDNILFYARLYGLGEKEAKEMGKKLLERFGLLEHANKEVAKYSGGMKRRLCLAISLLHKPKLLILDEPTTGLDPGIRRSIWDIFIEEKRKGKAILLATHYMEEADYLSDRIYIIYQGKIIAEGAPEELKTKYGPRSVIEIEFYKSPPVLREKLDSLGLAYTFTDTILRIQTNEPDSQVSVIVSVLHDIGASIKTLRVTKPTLEDVFLKLTGKRLEE